MNKLINVSVIVLSWNRKNDTIETVKSLSKSKIKDFVLEIVVVDNGSTDGSQKAVDRLFKKIKGKKNIKAKLIENEKNLGFCKGNNVGMRYALENSSDYIMLLNDDVIVEEKLILNLVEFMEKENGVGAVSPKIYFAKGYEFHKDRYKKSELGKVIWYAGGDIDWDNVYGSNHGVDEVDRGQYDEVSETDFTTGCCVIFPAKVLEDVGMYDNRYFAYYEDADLSVRMKKAGFKVLFVPTGILWHKVAQSSGIGSDLNDYFTTRNRMLFGMQHARLRTKIALIRESLKLLFNGREWQKIGVRDFYLRRFGRGSWKNE